MAAAAAALAIQESVPIDPTAVGSRRKRATDDADDSDVASLPLKKSKTDVVPSAAPASAEIPLKERQKTIPSVANTVSIPLQGQGDSKMAEALKAYQELTQKLDQKIKKLTMYVARLTDESKEHKAEIAKLAEQLKDLRDLQGKSSKAKGRKKADGNANDEDESHIPTELKDVELTAVALKDWANAKKTNNNPAKRFIKAAVNWMKKSPKDQDTVDLEHLGEMFGGDAGFPDTNDQLIKMMLGTRAVTKLQMLEAMPVDAAKVEKQKDEIKLILAREKRASVIAQNALSAWSVNCWNDGDWRDSLPQTTKKDIEKLNKHCIKIGLTIELKEDEEAEKAEKAKSKPKKKMAKEIKATKEAKAAKEIKDSPPKAAKENVTTTKPTNKANETNEASKMVKKATNAAKSVSEQATQPSSPSSPSNKPKSKIRLLSVATAPSK